jgi:hypothetical protein
LILTDVTAVDCVLSLCALRFLIDALALTEGSSPSTRATRNWCRCAR